MADLITRACACALSSSGGAAKTGAPLFAYDTVAATAPDAFGDRAATSCVETGGQDTTSTDDALLSPGALRYYLVRPENVCGAGPSGISSTGTPRVVRDCT